MSAWKTLLRKKKNPELGPLTHSQLIIFPRQDAPLLSAKSAKCFRMFVIAAFLTAPRETPRLLHQPTTPSPAPLLPDLFVKFSSSLPFFFFPFVTLKISRCDYNLEDPHFVATRSNASSREAGGSRTPGLSGGDLSQDTVCARASFSVSFILGHISEI